MVNGREVNSFNNEHLKITDSILANVNVSLLDQELRSSIIEGLKTIEKACLKSRPQNPETEVRVPVNDPLGSSVNAQSDCSRAIESDPADQNEICPMCDEGVEDGICCDRCLKWYHFPCESLSDSDIDRFRDTDMQYLCISCGYENQCQLLNDSILFTRPDICESDEITHPKTLDCSIDHSETHTSSGPQPGIMPNSAACTPESFNVTQKQSSGEFAKQSCTPSIKPTTEAVNGLTGTDRNRPDIMGHKTSSHMPQSYSGAGLVCKDATGKVVAGKANDKVISGHPLNVESPRVQVKAVPNVKDPQEKQHKPCRAQADLNGPGADSEPTQDSNVRGQFDSQGGACGKPVKQNSKQTKKIDKSKFKDEQDEQLKLARSLISNLERKVGELENTNRILRQDLNTNLSTIKTQIDQPLPGFPRDNNNTGNPSNIGIPQMRPEIDLRDIKENLRSIELEQIRARIQNIEQTMNLHNQVRNMYPIGFTGNIPINPSHFGMYGQWPVGGQIPYTPNPYPSYAIPQVGPYLHVQRPMFMNMHINSPLLVPPYGPGFPNYPPPQFPQTPNFSNLPQMGPSVLRNPQQSMPNMHRAGQRVTGVHNGTGVRVVHQNYAGEEPSMTSRQSERSRVHQQSTTAYTDRKMEQNQILTSHRDNNAPSIIDLTNQTEVQACPSEVHPSGPAPQVLVCSDAEDHLTETRRLSKDPGAVQEGMVLPTEGSGTVTEAPYSRRVMHKESNKEPENTSMAETKSEKPFLGAGRASENTAKRKSL